MSDKVIRELEDLLKSDPDNEEIAERLANVKARAGQGTSTYFTITNEKGKNFYRIGHKSTYKNNGYQTRRTISFSDGGHRYENIDQVITTLSSIIDAGLTSEITTCRIVKHVTVDIDVGDVASRLEEVIANNLAAKKADLEKRLRNLEMERENQMKALNRSYEERRIDTLKEVEKVKRKLSKDAT